MPCSWGRGHDPAQTSIRPTWMHRKAIPIKTQWWCTFAEMKTNKETCRDKSYHPLLRLTIEISNQETVAQTEGQTHRSVEQIDSCGKPTNTPPQARLGIFFFQYAGNCGLLHTQQVLYHWAPPQPYPLTADKDPGLPEEKVMPSASTWSPIGKRQKKVLREKGPCSVRSSMLSTNNSNGYSVSNKHKPSGCVNWLS